MLTFLPISPSPIYDKCETFDPSPTKEFLTSTKSPIFTFLPIFEFGLKYA